MGCDLFEQLQPFCADSIFEILKAGRIASRSRQICNKTTANRISNGYKHERNRACFLLQRANTKAAGCKDDVRSERDQFRGMSANARGLASSPSDLNIEIMVLAPA